MHTSLLPETVGRSAAKNAWKYSTPHTHPSSIGHPPSLLLRIYLHTFAANITLNSVLSREGHYYETMTREPKICISIYNLKEATPNVKSTVTDVAE